MDLGIGLGLTIPRVGGAAFTDPTGITGNTWWLDASQISGGLVNNDPVTTWNDLSPSGKNATQATAAKKPLYKTNQLNGLPIVSFDATDDVLATASAVQTTLLYTIAIVAKYTNGVSAAQYVFNGEDAIGTGYGLGVPGTSSHRILHRGVTVLDSQTDPAAGFEILVSQWDGSTGKMWINGVAQTLSNDTSGPLQPANTPITIMGGQSAASVQTGFDCAEVAIYDNAISASDRAALEAYLADKYAITLG